jgi:hypothetical protein
MSIDMILGLILLIGTLGLITILVYWSKKTIDSIANAKNHSLDEIQQEVNENG